MEVLNRGRVGETYCIGGNSEKTNLEVVDTICGMFEELKLDHSPHQNLKIFVKDRPRHGRRYAIDGSKLKSELGWSPKHSFEDGMRKTIKCYLDNSEWCENVTTGKYQGERLGSA